MLITDIFHFARQPIPVYTYLGEHFNISGKACMMLSVIAWKTMPESDGWTAITVEQLCKLSAFTEREQKSARKELIVAGILEEKFLRLEHKLMFRLLPVNVAEKDDAVPEARKARLGSAESAVGDSGKRAPSIEEKKYNKEEASESPDDYFSEAETAARKQGISALDIVEPDDVFKEWNDMAEGVGLPKCLKTDGERRVTVRNRLKDKFFAEHWREAMQLISKSEFCLGKTGWKADIEFFLRPNTVAKVMEGKYANRQPTPVKQMAHTGNF